MKRQLKLAKESIQQLVPSQLAHVAGGVPTSAFECPTLVVSCKFSCTCISASELGVPPNA